MPRNKHKRKASAHSKSKSVKGPRQSWIRALNPKIFVLLGVFLVALGAYLLIFKSHSGAMPGFAMLSIIAGVVIGVFAGFSLPKKKTD